MYKRRQFFSVHRCGMCKKIHIFVHNIDTKHTNIYPTFGPSTTPHKFHLLQFFYSIDQKSNSFGAITTKRRFHDYTSDSSVNSGHPSLTLLQESTSFVCLIGTLILRPRQTDLSVTYNLPSKPYYTSIGIIHHHVRRNPPNNTKTS